MDAHLLAGALEFLALNLVEIDAEYTDIASLELFGQSIELWNFGAARRAPFGPVVEHHPLFVQSLRGDGLSVRSEEHTSELQSLMRISHAASCLKHTPPPPPPPL